MTKEGIKPFAPTGYRTLNPRTAMFYYATGITPAMIMRLTNIGSQYLGAFVDSPACPFWAHRRRPLEPPAAVLTAIASYREDQWEALLATVADRDELEATWEQWNAGIEKLIAGLEARSIPYVRVLLDVEEIEQFCEEQGIPNDAKARSNLAIRKAEQNAR